MCESPIATTAAETTRGAPSSLPHRSATGSILAQVYNVLRDCANNGNPARSPEKSERAEIPSARPLEVRDDPARASD
jgi:hypothetical protein